MKANQIREIATIYGQKLDTMDLTALNLCAEDLEHLKALPKQVFDLIVCHKYHEANRFLGMLQGLLGSLKIYSWEDLRTHGCNDDQ